MTLQGWARLWRGKKSRARRTPDAGSNAVAGDGFERDVFVSQMGSSVAAFRDDLGRLQVTADVGILDRVNVEAYGSKSPLKALAQVSLRDARTLVVDVFDQAVSTPVASAIRSAGLGLNPRTDGTTRMIVPIPKPSADARQKLRKIASSRAEETRSSIRRVRRKAMDSVAKLEGTSKDSKKSLEADVQRDTDLHINRVDVDLKEKLKDLDRN